MHSVTVFSAVVALGASLVSAQSTCTKDIKITEPTPIIECDVIDASVTVDKDVAGGLSIEGVEEITGSFTVDGAENLISISSSTIKSIGGVFELNALPLLSSLDMQALRSLEEIRFINLQQLSGLTFGTSGVTKVTTIQVSDTRIADLSGLNVATVKDFRIDNNPRLNKFNSDLVNITGTLIINNNGGGSGNSMAINMTMLESAMEVQLSGIESFSAPSLTEIGASIKFNKNPDLKSFKADNVTEVGKSLTFINNKNLANISFAALTKISGDLTIQNNTALEELEGFPELKSVYGGVLLAGAFETVELPKLDDVLGTVKVTSTTDISDFCEYFDDLKSDNSIRGDEDCSSNNDDALENGDGGENNDGSSGGSSDDDTDAAGMVSVNMALLGLAAFAGLAQLF